MYLTSHIGLIIFATSLVLNLICCDKINSLLTTDISEGEPPAQQVFISTKLLTYRIHSSHIRLADYIGHKPKRESKDQNHEQAQKIFALTANCKRSRINYREVSKRVMLGADPTPENVWSVYRKIKSDET